MFFQPQIPSLAFKYWEAPSVGRIVPRPVVGTFTYWPLDYGIATFDPSGILINPTTSDLTADPQFAIPQELYGLAQINITVNQSLRGVLAANTQLLMGICFSDLSSSVWHSVDSKQIPTNAVTIDGQGVFFSFPLKNQYSVQSVPVNGKIHFSIAMNWRNTTDAATDGGIGITINCPPVFNVPTL